MRCNNCGYDNNENARFCQSCGSTFVFNQNPLAVRMLRLLKDDLFMVLCIIYSVSVGLSLINGGIPILKILMIIFLWLIFSQSRNGIVTPNYFRYISGIIFALYVIKWILYCIIIFCGIFFVILSFSMDVDNLGNMFYSEIEPYISDYFGIFAFITNSYLLILSVVIIIIAIVGIFLNVLGRRSIHRFAKSIYKSLEYGKMSLSKRSAAYTWLLVFGIINVIYAIFDLARGNMASFLETSCLSATYIIGSTLINKHLRNHR